MAETQQSERQYGIKTWNMILSETIASIHALSATKGDEYKASNDDQLANFRRRAGRFKAVPPELVWAVYAGKHWDALETYIDDLQTGTVRQRSEPIEGRIDDLIVYLILFKVMCAERSGSAAKCTVCTVCNGSPDDRCERDGCPHSIPF